MKRALGLAVFLIIGTAGAATLEGFASLEPGTLMPGPDSGQFIEPPPGTGIPFGGQVAQGFSAIVPDGRGAYFALADNGFGSPGNSPDFVLRIYTLTPRFRTANGGPGEIFIDGFVDLADPGRRMPYRITADHDCYLAARPCTPVDPRIRSSRLLTGADLDPESLQVDRHGDFWIGDEIGPFLLRFSRHGVLQDSPYTLHGLTSESRPGADPATVTVKASKGFEGMARGISGAMLFPVLEAPISGQGPALNIYSFDTESRQFRNDSGSQPTFRYPLNPPATAIGAFKLFGETAGLMLERDSSRGPEAVHKRIYRVDLETVDADGFLHKQLLLDLLDIADPHDLDGDGNARYAMSLSTIEGLAVTGRNHLVIVSDNNYPFGDSRGSRPEATEMILVRVPDLW